MQQNTHMLSRKKNWMTGKSILEPFLKTEPKELRMHYCSKVWKKTVKKCLGGFKGSVPFITFDMENKWNCAEKVILIMYNFVIFKWFLDECKKFQSFEVYLLNVSSCKFFFPNVEKIHFLKVFNARRMKEGTHIRLKQRETLLGGKVWNR